MVAVGHGVLALALGVGAQDARVSEHGVEGHLRLQEGNAIRRQDGSVNRCMGVGLYTCGTYIQTWMKHIHHSDLDDAVVSIGPRIKDDALAAVEVTHDGA